MLDFVLLTERLDFQHLSLDFLLILLAGVPFSTECKAHEIPPFILVFGG